jgi:hypothetical protein
MSSKDKADNASKDLVKPRVNGFWIDPTFQLEVKYRPGDIIISVPAKSGTTWTMNIVHQLRSGGDPDVQDIYQQVPWLEFNRSPYETKEEKHRYFDSLPTWFPRAFKTHAPPVPATEKKVPGVPFRKECKYIVVIRNFEDAIASFFPFMHKHNDAFLDIWNLPPPMMKMVRPKDFNELWGMVKDNPGLNHALFLKLWWPHRNEPNVLFLHFRDMKKDHEGSINKIASFLGIKHSQETMKKIYEYTSFKWMKEHGSKFSVQHVCEVPVLAKDAMVRKGQHGGGKEMPASIREELQKRVDTMLDPACKKWYTEGGDLPK